MVKVANVACEDVVILIESPASCTPVKRQDRKREFGSPRRSVLRISGDLSLLASDVAGQVAALDRRAAADSIVLFT